MSTEKQELGKKALEIIADYPLYASTSGVTYDEAIQIAKIINNDFYKSTNNIIIT